uniref:Reverse transcriptase zinc-binding domain-containing protein n=1 Tax=Lactuca sativa TaxID=4236 RepID=A0A9R1WTC5_LACSA|nr:hypothetical protein LSAT_V11C100023850 [Lactuca sativa]
MMLRGHKRLSTIQEVIMLVFIWVVWNFRNMKAHSSSVKSHLVLAYEVQSLSFLWINARKRKDEAFRWDEWCSDPIRECYSRL